MPRSRRTCGPIRATTRSPRHLVERAGRLFDELCASAPARVVLHGDLHHDNVLRAGREPWLAIDPHGVVGDPGYEAGAMVYNPDPDRREDDLLALVPARIEQLADGMGLPVERVTAWAFVKAVLSDVWSAEDGGTRAAARSTSRARYCRDCDAAARYGRAFGVLGWLPDMTAWARVVADLLEPGGVLYLAEFHPFPDVLDSETGTTVTHDYFPAEPTTFDEPGSYADWRMATIHNRATLWRHGLGTIVSALCAAGLRIEFLHEHAVTYFGRFYNLVRHDDGSFHRPEGFPRLPMMFSVRATRS